MAEHRSSARRAAGRDGVRRSVCIADHRVNRRSRNRASVAPTSEGPHGRAMASHQPRVVIMSGDLVEQVVDAIVNAANNELQLGGGVAGAIRRAAGPTVQDECDLHGPVRVGEAAITGAGRLRARYVIHAASMALGGRTTKSALKSSMDHVFRLARSEEHTSELQSLRHLVCRLLLE